MRVKYVAGMIAGLFLVLYLSGCENNVTPTLEESIDLFTDLNPIADATNSQVVINRGSNDSVDSFFQIEVSDIGDNEFIPSGSVGAWCLEWKKPLRSNGDLHQDVKWYSTAGNDKWKPLNYLFSIKAELEMEDPSLTYREFQAVIWTLAGDMGIATEFNLDKLADSDLPSRLLKDGKANFSKTKVKEIVARVQSGAKAKIAGDSIPTGYVAETSGDQQDIFVPGHPADPCDEEIIDYNKVDVMLLFDDTGSFAEYVDDVAALFPSLINELETAFPDKDFAFGVSRFEDYGGPGQWFSAEHAQGRPFILNQPLVTKSAAGGLSARNNLITGALGRTAPGYGGDVPETAYHALHQLATGSGFDGNGNGNTTDSGNAGDVAKQTSPGKSGDVPAFSSNVLPTSGTLGGAGWRTDAQKIIVLATDACSVAPFDEAEGVPSEITGQPGTAEPVSRFLCFDYPGIFRYGYISDSKSNAFNLFSDLVAPSEVPTVQETVDALTTLGIQVVGLSTTGGATPYVGPSFSPSVFLTAMANLTGALDSSGNPLVFGISKSAASIADGIVDAVGVSACDATSSTLDKRVRFSKQVQSVTEADQDTTRISNYSIFE